ncbi:MAG: alpha/beta hydrolase [Chloroflexi bacterium]|nr:alpha/beta hydrolase [Chloroflexota bacterium]
MDFADLRPTENWADLSNIRVRFLDWGGAGTPVLALHGLASSAHWYDLVAPLLNDRFRIIAPDQRGHGQSTQATTGYDWQSLASDAADLMDHLGLERAAVLGHSWGCNVAINLAAKFPQRVTSLVMIDGGLAGGRARTGVNSDGSWEEFRARIRPRDVSGTRADFLDRLRDQLSFCWNDDIERIVQTMVYEDENGQMHDILRPENHVQVMKAMYDEPTSMVWPQVVCPTLLVPAGPRPDRAGSENALLKEERVQSSLQGIQHSQVHWIPETIHDIGYHKPQELAQVIREFLAKE